MSLVVARTYLEEILGVSLLNLGNPIMNDINQSLPEITMAGMSTKNARYMALALTLAILAFMAYAMTEFVFLIDAMGYSNAIVMLSVVLILATYYKCKVFLPVVVAKRLLRTMPILALYENDKRILKESKTVLLSISKQVDFSSYLKYSYINPLLNTQRSLKVVQVQQAGKLEEWCQHYDNHRDLAVLVYQILLVKAFVQKYKS